MARRTSNVIPLRPRFRAAEELVIPDCATCREALRDELRRIIAEHRARRERPRDDGPEAA